MIYITKDTRNPDNHIHYDCVMSRRKLLFKSSAQKRNGFFVKLKLYDPLVGKYTKQIVFIKQDKIEFSKNEDVFMIAKLEGE